MEAQIKRQKRSDPQVRKHEARVKRQKRSNHEVSEKDRKYMRQKRSDSKVKEMEAKIKRQKRSDPQVREHETRVKRQKRSNPEVSEKDREYMRQKRSDPKVKDMEAQIKWQNRSDPQVSEKDREREKRRRHNSKDKRGVILKLKEMEAEWKRVRCQDTLYKNKKTIQNALQKQRACQDPYKVLNEKQQADNRKFGSNMTELLKIFNESIAEGPVYVCRCCQQIWFRHSAFNVDEITLKSDNERTTFSTCRTLSKHGKEWICKTYRNSVKEGKIPKLSIENKMGFLELPHQLKLYSMKKD